VLLEQQRPIAAGRRVHCRPEPGRPAADDDHIPVAVVLRDGVDGVLAVHLGLTRPLRFRAIILTHADSPRYF
jgi:hypothetical protein